MMHVHYKYIYIYIYIYKLYKEIKITLLSIIFIYNICLDIYIYIVEMFNCLFYLFINSRMIYIENEGIMLTKKKMYIV